MDRSEKTDKKCDRHYSRRNGRRPRLGKGRNEKQVEQNIAAEGKRPERETGRAAEV
ncbi:hypothetical protein [Clostridium sp. KNHs216]|uniref:hypothetical protein n=1 Tax=Clostridium sp. KNHs216 TaxID=1550235 RepID=UPI00163A824F|nr:hypothetical protein [Clostridium sp. KNHs216]